MFVHIIYWTYCFYFVDKNDDLNEEFQDLEAQDEEIDVDVDV